MNYEQLLGLVGGDNPQSATYQDIVSGIQSQYTPQTRFAKTQSLLDTLGEQLPEQRGIAYGALLQGQGPRKITPIDLSKYLTNTEDMSGGTYDGGGGGGNDGIGASNVGGNTGFTVGPDGIAVANTVSQAAATAFGIVTGLPLGLAASAINAMNVAAANAANAAIAAADADSTAISGATATAGATGTGAAAAAAGSAAAAAASAAGMSDAAAAAAGQAAANAAISGASAAAAAAAGAQAAADATNAAAASASDANAGSDGSAGAAVSGEAGWAKGGLVTMNRLIGTDPMGQDEGYGALQSGEYVIKKNAVDKYGEEFLGLLNSGKFTKKQINSLL